MDTIQSIFKDNPGIRFVVIAENFGLYMLYGKYGKARIAEDRLFALFEQNKLNDNNTLFL